MSGAPWNDNAIFLPILGIFCLELNNLLAKIFQPLPRGKNSRLFRLVWCGAVIIPEQRQPTGIETLSLQPLIGATSNF